MTRSKISNHIKKKWEIKYALISDERNDAERHRKKGKKKRHEKKSLKDFVYGSINV